MWRCYETRMIEVAEKAMIAACDRALDSGMKGIFKELGISIDADEFMEPFRLMTNDNVNLVFHLVLFARAKDHRLSRELEWWETPKRPTEGEKADLFEYVIANELDTLLPRDAVLAGLALILVASMKVNDPSQPPSLTKARGIIGEAVVLQAESVR
jgi:hypothetical protein